MPPAGTSTCALPVIGTINSNSASKSGLAAKRPASLTFLVCDIAPAVLALERQKIFVPSSRSSANPVNIGECYQKELSVIHCFRENYLDQK
jgi:hypothetical protein